MPNSLATDGKKAGNYGRKLKPFHQEDIKAKIQCSQLINLVQEYAFTGEYQGREISPMRITTAFKLLDYRLSRAIPDEQRHNLNANTALAMANLQPDQLKAMALEMLQNQALTIDATPAHALADPSEDSLPSVEMSVIANVSEDLPPHGKGGVGGDDGLSHSEVTQDSTNPYPYSGTLPEELG